MTRREAEEGNDTEGGGRRGGGWGTAMAGRARAGRGATMGGAWQKAGGGVCVCIWRKVQVRDCNIICPAAD